MIVVLEKNVMKLLLLDLNGLDSEINEPINILTLESYLSHYLRFLDIDIKSNLLEDIKLIEYEQYDIIGISSKIGSKDILFQVIDKIYRLKKTIIVGNVLATYCYYSIIKKFPKVICVRFEGEHSLLRLIENYCANKKSLDNNVLGNIPNLVYKKNGEIVATDIKTVALDKYPIVLKKSLVKNVFDKQILYRIEASRGCTWNNCTFCLVGEKYIKGYKTFDNRKIISEIISANKIGIKKLFFTDEDFLGNDLSRIDALANQITVLKLKNEIDANFSFFISTKANDIVNIYRIGLLKKIIAAGFNDIFVGIESGSRTQLMRYCKGSSIKINASSLKILKEFDIHIDIGFIFFDPLVTIEELEENIEFIIEHLLSVTSARLIKPMLLSKSSLYYKKYRENVQFVSPVKDSIFIDYRFRKDIQPIYNKYFEYEQFLFKETNKIQYISRSMDNRYEMSLKELRYMDLMALKTIIKNINDKPNIMENNLNKLIQNKKDIIKKILG